MGFVRLTRAMLISTYRQHHVPHLPNNGVPIPGQYVNHHTHTNSLSLSLSLSHTHTHTHTHTSNDEVSAKLSLFGFSTVLNATL